MSRLSVMVTACAMVLYSSISFAHHSHAMFDPDKITTLSGTVKEFDFMEPHSFIQLLSDQDHQVWSIELQAGPSLGSRYGGWNRNALRAGDKVTAKIHPLRSGALGGDLLELTKADGTKLGFRVNQNQGAPGQAPAQASKPPGQG
jgi:hypothetical protein